MERFWKKKVVASLFSKGDVSRDGLLALSFIERIGKDAEIGA